MPIKSIWEQEEQDNKKATMAYQKPPIHLIKLAFSITTMGYFVFKEQFKVV